MPLSVGGELEPSLELGMRHDGGDAETGFGADIGAGLGWTDPARGLKAEARARGLLTHEDDGFRERGFSGSVAWQQKPSSDRGATLSLSQTVGGSSSGGGDALFSRNTLDGLAANDIDGGGNDLESRRLEAKFGYGFAAFGDRFTWTPEVGIGLSDTGRDFGVGWRLLGGGGSESGRRARLRPGHRVCLCPHRFSPPRPAPIPWGAGVSGMLAERGRGRTGAGVKEQASRVAVTARSLALSPALDYGGL